MFHSFLPVFYFLYPDLEYLLGHFSSSQLLRQNSSPGRVCWVKETFRGPSRYHAILITGWPEGPWSTARVPSFPSLAKGGPESISRRDYHSRDMQLKRGFMLQISRCISICSLFTEGPNYPDIGSRYFHMQSPWL